MEVSCENLVKTINNDKEIDNNTTINSDKEIYKNNNDGTFSVAGKVIDEEIGDYYFETDNFALKENPDYCKLLRAVAVLEAQKVKAIQDLDKLIDAKQQALSNPFEFVSKLQKTDDLNLPKPQKIYDLPDIEWEKYTTKLGCITHKHMTRHKRPTTSSNSDSNNLTPSSSTIVANKQGKSAEPSLPTVSVRGRLFTPGKPKSFNQPWSQDEQKMLVDLLSLFPPEAVEARRWEKIAAVMGSRTPLQVASRCQKYFIKLTKAGLPVPGRIPNVGNLAKRKAFTKQQRNRMMFSQSTFFASHQPPVYMSEYDDDITMHSCTSSNDGSMGIGSEMFQQDESNREFESTQDFKDYFLSRNRRRNDRQNRNWGPTKCFVCNQLIVGSVWRCMDCPKNALTLCNNCFTCPIESSTHRPNHQLVISTEDDNDDDMNLDDDYITLQNYLDPNFIPDPYK